MSILENCSQKISDLTELLEQESKLLSEGRLDGLQEVFKRKAAEMAELERLMKSLDDDQNMTPILPQISRLKRIADENGVILKSVMTGLRSARERLKLLMNEDAKVGAYGRSGSELFISDDQYISEKRI